MPQIKKELCEAADAMFRSAVECCRQHRRYAVLVEAGVDDGETDSVLPVVALCNHILEDSCALYERACGKRGNGIEEAWWHRANVLWHAAREHVRHQYVSVQLTPPRARHDASALSAMLFEHALEASALFGLRQAVEEYRSVRPSADLLAKAAPAASLATAVPPVAARPARAKAGRRGAA